MYYLNGFKTIRSVFIDHCCLNCTEYPCEISSEASVFPSDANMYVSTKVVIVIEYQKIGI
jgi:hypothetical protein